MAQGAKRRAAMQHGPTTRGAARRFPDGPRHAGVPAAQIASGIGEPSLNGPVAVSGGATPEQTGSP